MSNSISYCRDRANLAEISNHLLRADTAFEPALSGRVNIQLYAQKLHDKAVRFEAWVNQELVGMVATYCNMPDGGKAFISSVSVLPDWQGQGVASRLMQQCIEHIQREGIYYQVELEVDQRSQAALALYRKLGFNSRQISGTTFSMEMKLERQINGFSA